MRSQEIRTSERELAMSEYLQVRSNGQITLPAPTRRKAHIKEGDLLEAVVEADGTIRLVPKLAVDRALVEQHQLDDSQMGLTSKNGTKSQPDIIDELMTHPLNVEGFRPMTRDEAHARQ
jgi:AbrB family looped-hinge helix DNA binding protein